MLKRHRIPRAEYTPDNEPLHGERSYWHWTDLRVGSVVDFYGKKYQICSTDDFTRDYLESEGIHLNDKEVNIYDPLCLDMLEEIVKKDMYSKIFKKHSSLNQQIHT